MKILSVRASNFGSYEHVAFDPNNKGLTLISGPTGSGKSTIPDIILWALYGKTSKNGNIDDVCNWAATAETTASVVVQTRTGDLVSVHRSRAGNLCHPSGNDLFYSIGALSTAKHRGRNSVETQSLLSGLLGADADGFLSSGFLCESSPASAFFFSSAKERRKVLDGITDLSFSTTLSETIVISKKELKLELKVAESILSRSEGAAEQVRQNLSRLVSQAEQWDRDQTKLVETENLLAVHFDAVKKSKVDSLLTKSGAWNASKVSDLTKLSTKYTALENKLHERAPKSAPCPTCGASKNSEEMATLKGEIHVAKFKYETRRDEANPFPAQVVVAKAEENRCHERAHALSLQSNPHLKYLADVSFRAEKHETELSLRKMSAEAVKEKLSALDQVQDHLLALRGLLLDNSVKNLEDKTNAHLEAHFDSEFRVAFDAKNGDAIEVEIIKDSYLCTYRQLSKGQRQLLRLCFTVAVMEASANNIGSHFDQLFFDEALDGLDDASKIKAFRLFEYLADKHGSVFVIDHAPAFQDQFENRWTLSTTSNGSKLDFT